MDSDWRKRIQITLIIFLVIAGIRLGVIFYNRAHEPEIKKQAPVSNSSYKVTLDDYVTPHKLFPYDVNSAKELAGKTAWVRVGNTLANYPYSGGRIDLTRRAGLLGPLEKIEVKDVIGQNVRGQKQVIAIFTRAESPAKYGVTIGKYENGFYTFFINDIFFIDDPHQLYNHWPAEVWQAIDRHTVTKGMNELQASFALGANMRVSRGDYGNRTVEYIDGAKSTTVNFSDNQATSIEQGTAQ